MEAEPADVLAEAPMMRLTKWEKIAIVWGAVVLAIGAWIVWG